MQFLYPNVLFLMLIPTILLIFLLNTKKSTLQTHFDPDILNALSAHSKGLNKTTRNYLFFIALILMIIGLARPVINEKEQTIQQETIPLVIALDISKSMLAQDVYPNRLLLAKQKLQTLLEHASNYSIGVILFGQSSFIVSPLTNDFHSLKQMIKGLDLEQMHAQGSNIQAVLEASNSLLKEYNNKNILLLTDGGNEENYDLQTAYAQKNNLHIYTLAVATNNPTPIPTKDGYQTTKEGTIVMVQQNEAIKTLSLQNGGGYIQFSITSDDITQILNDINTQTKRDAQVEKRFKTYTELFYYPLGFALLLLFVAFSSLPKFKKTSASLCVLCMLGHPFASKASILDFQTLNDAKEAYSNQEYKKSAKLYEDVVSNAQGYYNLGNAYYKQGQYKKAIEAYKKVVTEKKDLEASKLHNLGNSYAKLGALKEAKVSYENALKLKYDEETKKNLEAVKKAMKDKKEKQQNKQKEDNPNQEENQKSKSKDSQNNKNKDSKKNNEKNKQNKEKKQPSSQQNSEQKREENASQKNQEKQSNTQTQQAEEISDLEEKKWLKKLQEQNNKTFLRKYDTQSDEETSPSSPW